MARHREYPRIKWGEQGYLKRKTCMNCGCRTRHNIIIETSWFRGEDDVYKVCLGCQKELRTRHADDEVDDVIDEIFRADKKRNPRPNQTQR